MTIRVMNRVGRVQALWGWWRGNRTRTLLYHSISDTPNDPFATRPELFRAHMQWLSDHGWRVVSCDSLLNNLVTGQTQRKTVALTFDDAFEDFATEAAPVLRHYGWPATVFVPTGFFGRSSVWSAFAPRRHVLDDDALSRLVGDFVQLGSHTVTHADLLKQDDAGLQWELSESLSNLQAITGQSDVLLAYPFGRAGERERNAAARTGYNGAFLAGGLWGNGLGSDRYGLVRDLIDGKTDLERFGDLVTGREDGRRLVRAMGRPAEADQRGKAIHHTSRPDIGMGGAR